VPGVGGAGLLLDEEGILRDAARGGDGGGNGPPHMEGEGGGLAGVGVAVARGVGAGEEEVAGEDGALILCGGEGVAAVDGVGGGVGGDEGAHEVVVAPVAAGGEVDVVPGVGDDGVV